MLIHHNNMHDFDTFIFFKWVFKTFAAVLIVTELTTWALIVCIGDLLRAYDDTVTNGDGRPMRMPVRERLTQWFEHTLEMMGWLTWRR